ncbi:MAG: sulfur carrier protein ThiS [Nitrospira sp.]
MSESIRIQINGEIREWRSGATVADLLRDLEIGADRVAVEVNLQIVDRAKFADHRLQDGDRVEILSFIGGGTWRIVEARSAGSLAHVASLGQLSNGVATGDGERGHHDR